MACVVHMWVSQLSRVGCGAGFPPCPDTDIPMTSRSFRYRTDVQKLNEEILELDEVLYGMEKDVEVCQCVCARVA